MCLVKLMWYVNVAKIAYSQWLAMNLTSFKDYWALMSVNSFENRTSPIYKSSIFAEIFSEEGRALCAESNPKTNR